MSRLHALLLVTLTSPASASELAAATPALEATSAGAATSVFPDDLFADHHDKGEDD